MQAKAPATLKVLLLPWLMWGAGGLFYFYEFFVQVSPNVMVPELMRDFVISATGLGILHSVYFWSYAGLQIPAGLFLDLLGPRKLLTFAALNCAAGCLLFGVAHQFQIALLARFMIGVGSAFAAIGCLKLAANWFPMRRFALMTGLTVTIGMSGAVMGQAPLAMIVEIFSWRTSMIILGIVGLLLALVFILFIRDQDDTNTEIETVHYPSFKDITQGLAYVVTSRQLWLTAIYGSLMFAPSLTFGELWGASYLMLKFGISRPEAAASISLIFIGWIVAAPLSGYISDKIGRRLPTMIIGSIGSFITMTVFLYWPNISFQLSNILLFLFGVLSAGFLPAFSMMRESSPKKSTATALGFMNMMNMVGLVFTNPFIGYLLDRFYSGKLIHGVHDYTLADYNKALFILPVILFLSIVILPFINETYCRFTEDQTT